MMIMIRRAGMTHTRQNRSRWPDERIEKWPWIRRTEMPSQPQGAIDSERDLMIGQRDNLATGNGLGHGRCAASIVN
jgi:hypothetical protein